MRRGEERELAERGETKIGSHNDGPRLAGAKNRANFLSPKHNDDSITSVLFALSLLFVFMFPDAIIDAQCQCVDDKKLRKVLPNKLPAHPSNFQLTSAAKITRKEDASELHIEQLPMRTSALVVIIDFSGLDTDGRSWLCIGIPLLADMLPGFLNMLM